MVAKNMKEMGIAGLDTTGDNLVWEALKSKGGAIHVMSGLTVGLDHTQLISLTTSYTLADYPSNAKAVTFQVETQNVRMTFDGSVVPTATIGHEFSAGPDQVTITLADWSQWKIIAQTSGATMQVTFWG